MRVWAVPVDLNVLLLYCCVRDSLAGVTQRMGLRGIIWDLDTLDWLNAATNPSYVISSFKTNLAAMGSSGIIQLQHDIINQSIALVPQVCGTS